VPSISYYLVVVEPVRAEALEVWEEGHAGRVGAGNDGARRSADWGGVDPSMRAEDRRPEVASSDWNRVCLLRQLKFLGLDETP
jgi:hypothetical protein